MRVVLTGGGTGGHIYPALSIAERVRELRPEADLLFVGSRHGPEAGLAEEHNLPFVGIPSRPLTLRPSLGTLRALGLLALGVFRAKRVLDDFAPDVVIGTGGYTSAAVVLAQGLLRRGPAVIQEQNLLPGRTNLFVSRFASAVCVAFEESAGHFESGKLRVEVTGVPIRKGILERPPREDARRSLGLAPDVFTVLATGGSQGARRLNKIVLESLPLLAKPGLQIVHLVGRKDYDAFVAQAGRTPDWYRPVAYSSDMATPYAAADLAISRSGASTLAELAACGLPAILVPYPFAYADHQRLNAESVARRGAALVVEQKDLAGAVLAGMVLDLQADAERLAAMSKASLALGKPDAADRVARLAFELTTEAQRG